VAGDYVNLNDVGTLSRSGQGYDTNAQDNATESRTFSGRMDASQRGLRGSAGNTFTTVAATHSANLGLLAGHIAEQALRAVRAEQSVLAGDDEANTAQSGTVSTVESNATAVSRPINV
jgi:hypothetical protein